MLRFRTDFSFGELSVLVRQVGLDPEAALRPEHIPDTVPPEIGGRLVASVFENPPDTVPRDWIRPLAQALVDTWTGFDENPSTAARRLQRALGQSIDLPPTPVRRWELPEPVDEDQAESPARLRREGDTWHVDPGFVFTVPQIPWEAKVIVATGCRVGSLDPAVVMRRPSLPPLGAVSEPRLRLLLAVTCQNASELVARDAPYSIRVRLASEVLSAYLDRVAPVADVSDPQPVTLSA